MNPENLNGKDLHDLKVKIKKGVVFKDLDNEMIIMDMDSGKYFGLNETGAAIWTLISKHHTLGEVLKRLLEEYEVPAQQLENELRGFLKAIYEKGLVDVEPST